MIAVEELFGEKKSRDDWWYSELLYSEQRERFWSFLIFEQHHQSKNQLERAARAEERRERDAPELGLLFVYLGRRESVIKVCGPTFFWVSFLVLFLLEMKHCASSQLHSLCRWCHIWDKSKTNPNQKNCRYPPRENEHLKLEIFFFTRNERNN